MLSLVVLWNHFHNVKTMWLIKIQLESLFCLWFIPPEENFFMIILLISWLLTTALTLLDARLKWHWTGCCLLSVVMWYDENDYTKVFWLPSTAVFLVSYIYSANEQINRFTVFDYVNFLKDCFIFEMEYNITFTS